VGDKDPGMQRHTLALETLQIPVERASQLRESVAAFIPKSKALEEVQSLHVYAVGVGDDEYPDHISVVSVTTPAAARVFVSVYGLSTAVPQTPTETDEVDIMGADVGKLYSVGKSTIGLVEYCKNIGVAEHTRP
jgi:hypothetical protein